jgi:hypothetical protein
VLSPLVLHCDRHTKSFKLHHLEQWKCDSELWDVLPEEMIEPVKMVQHAGATVMTVLERIHKFHEELEGKIMDSDEEDIDSDFVSSPVAGTTAIGLGMTAAKGCDIDGVTSKLESLQIEEALVRTPSLYSLPSLPESLRSSRSASQTMLESLPELTSAAIVDLSKMTADAEKRSGEYFPLPPSTPPIPWRNGFSVLPRTRSFNRPPKDPRVSRWRQEVSYLRGSAMVNLRHWLKRVDSQWTYCCSQHGSLATPSTPDSLRSSRSVDNVPMQWECWLLKVKRMAADLEQRNKDVAPFEVVGWGP